jgi:hypothetical protein
LAPLQFRATDEAHSDIGLAYDLAIRSNGKTSFRGALSWRPDVMRQYLSEMLPLAPDT